MSTTMAKGFRCKVFTDRMPFLSPSQQCQSTEREKAVSAVCYLRQVNEVNGRDSVCLMCVCLCFCVYAADRSVRPV